MPKILVADDNTNIQKMVALALGERGIDVISVGNGEAAVRRLPDLVPDLVLADIFMPVRNGYEVCEYVKRDPRFSHIPVILLVGAFDPLDEKEAHRVGADGVLKKPFVPPDPLIAMVTSVLEKNPKLAAELAAAKKAKTEPPPPVAAETQSKKTPVKAPNPFPEPAPDEAALIYGFGSGRRTLDPVKASSEAQVPVAEAEEGEEFDGAATTSDWRRSAMDFEVSEEDAKRPAFADDSASFPSESDLPLRQAIAPEPPKKIEPIVLEKAPEVAEVPELSEEPEVPATVAQVFSEQPKGEDGAESVASAETLEPEVREMQVVEASTPEPSFASKAAGWIESIFPAKYPQGGWLSSITGGATKTEPAEAPETPEDLPLAHSENEEVAAEWKVLPEESAETEPATLHASIETLVQSPATDLQATDEDSFFADEPEPDDGDIFPAEAISGEDVPVHAEPQVPESVAIAPERPLFQFTTAPPQAVSLGTDPALIEPPAVRVVPEPLLVDDDLHGPSDYGRRQEELPPLHSFTVPVPPPAPTTPESLSETVDTESEPEIVPAESHAAETDERIPTGPPPNREALAEIPFLSPPPAFQEPLVHAGDALNSETVDAIVQKVLERLEPQLHELLSKGLLKPLVESILQSENGKKNN